MRGLFGFWRGKRLTNGTHQIMIGLPTACQSPSKLKIRDILVDDTRVYRISYSFSNVAHTQSHKIASKSSENLRHTCSSHRASQIEAGLLYEISRMRKAVLSVPIPLIVNLKFQKVGASSVHVIMRMRVTSTSRVGLDHARTRALATAGVRASVFLSCIGLRNSHYVATFPSIPRPLLLCAFRDRSRHTSGFDPCETFELPKQEFVSSCGDIRDRPIHPVGAAEGIGVTLRSTGGSDVFQWLETSKGKKELIAAAARCVLLHGLFEVWGHGRSQDEAAADAVRRFPQHLVDASWALGVTSYGRSNLTRVEEENLAGGPVNDFLTTSLRGKRTTAAESEVRVRIIEDICPCSTVKVPKKVRKHTRGSGTAAAKAALDARQAVQKEKRFYICRERQVGAAVGEGTVMGTTGRRPIRGILSSLALNARRYRGPTAIEPEVALVMANLARVRPGSFVSDPFCGSCSLLLPAAKMGAKTWGSDVAGPATAAATLTTYPAERGVFPVIEEADLEDDAHVDLATDRERVGADQRNLKSIYEDFSALGLTLPKLVKADIADEGSPARAHEFFDAIITDPPYNIKEKAVAPSTTRTAAADAATEDLTAAARKPHETDQGMRRRGDFLSSETQSCTTSAVRTVDSGANNATSTWEVGSGAKVMASDNNLVGEIIRSLISFAGHSLKPGGRLCFFLPLRGAEARLEALSPALLKELRDVDGARAGQRLGVVYTVKQRMSSPNMCRWLVVLEKEPAMSA